MVVLAIELNSATVVLFIANVSAVIETLEIRISGIALGIVETLEIRISGIALGVIEAEYHAAAVGVANSVGNNAMARDELGGYKICEEEGLDRSHFVLI